MTCKRYSGGLIGETGRGIEGSQNAPTVEMSVEDGTRIGLEDSSQERIVWPTDEGLSWCRLKRRVTGWNGMG